MTTGASPAVDPGSFRDREGRIYRLPGHIIRGVSDRALSNFQQLQATRFYSKFLEQGQIVKSALIPREMVPLPPEVKEQWAGFLQHDRIPVITYPYEWTFGMLRDAALLQLDLLEAAIPEGMTLKDATPYNIQFVSGRAVFIDIPSFETLPAGVPWSGYRQFCEMFLFPLMLQAYKGVNFQPFMRSGINGVALQDAARLFSFRDRFRSGVLTHIWLQAKLDRRFGTTRKDIRSELKSAGFSKELILANVRKMRKLVAGLDWQGEGSEWGNYAEFHNYSESDHSMKAAFVGKCAAASGARLAWDIGCNTGQFSKIVLQNVETVIAMDLDHFAVEQLYLETKTRHMDGMLTLVQNIADPSSNWGWRNRERSDLHSRARPDLILCLALIHHVVISANIPLNEFIEWLAESSDQLIIEYVSRKDDKVQSLLRNKADIYSDYSRKSLEQALACHYGIVEKQSLDSGNRFLYWCRRFAG